MQVSQLMLLNNVTHESICIIISIFPVPLNVFQTSHRNGHQFNEVFLPKDTKIMKNTKQHGTNIQYLRLLPFQCTIIRVGYSIVFFV